MNKIKEQFPLLKNNQNLIYFDNGATTLKPQKVIDAEIDYLTNVGANPHTNDYKNAYLSNEILISARKKTAVLINAKSPREVIFTSGATHSLNQVAFGLKKIFKKNDEIIITSVEHSANLLPWIEVANQTGAIVKNTILNKHFGIDIENLKSLINDKTKVIAFAHISNTFGYENDVKEIVQEVRKIKKDVIIVIDAAQSIAHVKVDVADWNIDFLAFSPHKMYGPFGLGILWGRFELLDILEPLFFGGGMSLQINDDFKEYRLYDLPAKLEAGTPNISAISAYEKAIDFIFEIGLENIQKHEKKLKEYIVKKIKENNLEESIEFYNLDNDSPLLLMNVKGINPQDIATFLDVKYNIATRSGSHCARRTSDLIENKVSLRVSFAIYNTVEEIDVLIEALKHTNEFLDFLF